MPAGRTGACAASTVSHPGGLHLGGSCEMAGVELEGNHDTVTLNRCGRIGEGWGEGSPGSGEGKATF